MKTASRPRSLSALYALEERRALDGLTRAASQAVEDVQRITRVEERVREHPLLAVGVAAALGYAAAPLVGSAVDTLLPFATRTLHGHPRIRALLHGFVSPDGKESGRGADGRA